MLRYCLIAGLLSLALSNASCSQDKPSQAAPAAARSETATLVTDQQNGKDVALAPGATMLVQLPGNPTTGYSWVVAGDPSPLKLVKSTFNPGTAGKQVMGAPGRQELQFSAAAAGQVSLTLEYRRPWEKQAPAKTFSVKVTVR